MRPGGGKFKGSEFERKVGKQLSEWLTGSSKEVRADLFTRNVLSGGKYTASKMREGIPGDLMAAHPVAYEFLQYFMVECKHYADLGIDSFFYDTGNKSFLASVIAKCEEQVNNTPLSWLLIVMQNRRPPLLITDSMTGGVARQAMPRRMQLKYHLLRTRTIFLMEFNLFLKLTAPKRFMSLMEATG